MDLEKSESVQTLSSLGAEIASMQRQKNVAVGKSLFNMKDDELRAKLREGKPKEE